MEFTEDQLQFIQEKKPELIKKPEPSLNDAIVEFLKKYEVFVKPPKNKSRLDGAIAGAITGIAGADVDNNGLIQAKDAWLINNYVVGKTVANSQVGSWDFIDSLANFDNLGMTNTKIENGNENLNDIAFTDQSRTFNMTSFINGDVDGSFASNLA